ncbi:MAG: four helix bundle protein [Rikenellaceae bacterium]
MAKYDQTPVFKQSYDLIIKLYEISPKLSRDVRYTLAEQLKKDTLDMLKLIYLANFKSQAKDEYIKQALTKLAVIRLQCRILKDLKQVTTKSYAQITLMTESIAAQLSSWLKYTKATNKNETTT